MQICIPLHYSKRFERFLNLRSINSLKGLKIFKKLKGYFLIRRLKQVCYSKCSLLVVPESSFLVVPKGFLLLVPRCSLIAIQKVQKSFLIKVPKSSILWGPENTERFLNRESKSFLNGGSKHGDIILHRSQLVDLYWNIYASASKWFYYKTLFWNFKYCCVQIEKVSYWLSSKQSMSNHVSVCQDMRYVFLIGFPTTINKPEIVNWIWVEGLETIKKLCISDSHDNGGKINEKKYWNYFFKIITTTTIWWNFIKM